MDDPDVTGDGDDRSDLGGDERLALEPGESLTATLKVTFAGRFESELNLPGHDRTHDTTPPNMGAMLRSMGGLGGGGSPRTRITGVGRYLQWQRHADAVGFPVAGMAMVLGHTERRLIVYRASFVRGRPLRAGGSLPLRSIAQAVVSRRAVSGRVLFVLDSGGIVTLETTSTRRARRFVESLLAARDRLPH